MLVYKEDGTVNGNESWPIIKEAIEQYPQKKYKEIGEIFGVSKNIIISIVNRKIKKEWEKERANNNKKSEVAQKLSESRSCLNQHKKSLKTTFLKEGSLGRNKTCQYFVGDDLTDESKCGEKVHNGSSWCVHHYNLVYRTDLEIDENVPEMKNNWQGF